jgi:hypothetical protein
LASQKPQLLMLMIASLASGAMAILLAIAVRESSLLVVSIPGFVVGGFFAFKYAMFDRKKAREEEHRKSRRNKH